MFGITCKRVENFNNYFPRKLNQYRAFNYYWENPSVLKVIIIINDNENYNDRPGSKL